MWFRHTSGAARLRINQSRSLSDRVLSASSLRAPRKCFLSWLQTQYRWRLFATTFQSPRSKTEMADSSQIVVRRAASEQTRQGTQQRTVTAETYPRASGFAGSAMPCALLAMLDRRNKDKAAFQTT